MPNELKFIIEDRPAPPTRNGFMLHFSQVGSTILDHELYAKHARRILADERNFLGLFALDTLLENRKGQYRHCDVTPKANHPLLLFFQIQNAHEHDKDHPDETPYLPDRPDLDKVLALIHDEGEDILGFNKEQMRHKMHNFINNIHDKIRENNEQYPDCLFPEPTEAEILQMRADINELIEDFDAISKKYKGEPDKESYDKYHITVLERPRATRIKIFDTVCNGATIAYRNKEMIQHPNRQIVRANYRDWAVAQMNKRRDIYFDRDFPALEGTEKTGFIEAAAQKHPNSAKIISLMGRVLSKQLRLYSWDLANERGDHGSPKPNTQLREYDSMCLSSRVNLIQITDRRLQEVSRLDSLKGKSLDKKRGMFGIHFRNPKHSHLPVLPVFSAPNAFNALFTP